MRMKLCINFIRTKTINNFLIKCSLFRHCNMVNSLHKNCSHKSIMKNPLKHNLYAAQG